MSWMTTTLGAIAPLAYGRALTASQRDETGSVPVVASGGIVGRHTSACTTGPVVVLGRKGSVGTVQYLEEDCWPIDTVFYTHGTEGTDTRFLSYLLTWLNLETRVGDSAVPGLNRADLESVQVMVPPLQYQKSIAEVLGTLDDKIASNRRVIEASESLSDALFSFVARAASGTTPAGTYFDLAYGKALPTIERKDGPVPVYGSGGIVGRHESPLFDGPGVVVGRKGSVGTVYWAEDGAFPIDTTFFIRPHGFPHIFVYLLLKRMRLPLMAADSAVPGLNRIRVLQESVPALSQADAQRLAAQVSPLFTKNHQLEQENTALTAVRDELLPQLMSGRITVKDAEKRVQEEV
ncbi:restriction endonuclease subunit S [Micrococcus luteus]|nr:restriction endonuclease subunit S [Micrococcus luteus]MCD0181248.1 restriction endonuclease subunit S [Micrococcus luteus]